MDPTTVEAAPSAAQESTPSLEIPRSGTTEYTEWRTSGKLPAEKAEPKSAEPAAATAETASAPAAETTTQEKPKTKAKTAEERIAQLEATIEKIRKGAGMTQQAAPSPAQVEQPKAQTQAEPAIDDKNQDGTPKFKSYEEFTKALARWEIKQEMAAERQMQQMRSQAQALEAKVNEARTRYENFDETKTAFLGQLIGTDGTLLVPGPVLNMLNDSDMMTDVIYTIGSSAEDTAAFIQMAKSNPGKAMRYIAKVETLIEETLSKPRDPSGKFAKPEPPAKRGPESAPEPPLEIGHRGTGPMDEAARALSEIERGNPSATRAWLKAENAKDLRRRRGV